ncbi:MAG: phosphate ABC transporter permease PstA [Lachnospiraceae bacterium]|nr:phosphate ABC transporter permease PstA [Lachnospiraceae bacterium]
MTKVQSDERIIKKNQIKAHVLKAVTLIAAALTVLVLGFLIVYILVKGVPHLTPQLFAWEYDSENVSMLPSIINTLIMTVLTLLIAIPFGIGSAIYLVEYASSKNRFVPVIRMTAETLTGIPSIVYGLFGMLFFNSLFGISILSGALTLAIMVLPVIMRTTEEALLSVPKKYREGSFGLGAGKLRTIFKIVLPAAMPGIFSGIVLSVGRIVGETAALIYTAGTVTKAASSIFNSGRTLSVHMYLLSKEGLNTDQAYATAVVLLVLVIFINFISGRIASGVQKQHGEA